MAKLWGAAALAAWVLLAGHALAGELPQGLGAGPRDAGACDYAVAAQSAEALANLSELGYAFEGMRGKEGVVFATEDEAAALRDAGFVLMPLGRPKALPEGYRSVAEVGQALADFAGDYPELCRVEAIGASVEGKTLWALRITDHPDAEEAEPEFKYVSTMHGSEGLGTELCLRFAAMLLEGYGTDARLTRLVDSTDIWLVPLMNPDGYEDTRRSNANGYDLNRSFPVWPQEFGDPLGLGGELWTGGREPEVRAIMEWTAAHRFVLSANFHTGALLVNYPYDDDDKGSVDSPTPDDLLFEALSLEYSRNNPPMYGSPYFTDGISNGADWYSIDGGMQDWNYRYAGCCAVTIELSQTFMPAASEFDAYWDDNREAMLAYLEGVHWGIHGVARNYYTAEPVAAVVTLEGNPQPVFSDPDVGDFHRLALPGTYDVQIEAVGYEPLTVEGVVAGEGAPAYLELEMMPLNPPPIPLRGAWALGLIVAGAGCVCLCGSRPRATGS